MILLHLELSDYRSWEKFRIDFIHKSTFFVGPNGVGKTNIAEAIVLLGSLHSHRTGDNHSLIRYGKEKAKISATVMVRNQKVDLELHIYPNSTQVFIDGKEIKPLRKILEYFSVVLFAPEDLRLVKGEPSNRRKFIDSLCFSPAQLALRAEYERLVKYRTALLKSLPDNPKSKSLAYSSLTVWDEKLLAAAVGIIKMRLTILDKFSPIFSDEYMNFDVSSPKVHILYSPYTSDMTEKDIEDKLRQDLLIVKEEELLKRQTLWGPHRDDFLLRIGVISSRQGASHGESWTLALALRMAEYKFLLQMKKNPVIIFDDVFAELDKYRRERFFDRLERYSQMIVTAAVREDIPVKKVDSFHFVDAKRDEEMVFSYLSILNN